MRAHNEYGWSDISLTNNDTTVLRVPQAPSNLGSGSDTSSTQIELTWNELTTDDEIGDTEVLAYKVQMVASTGTFDYEIAQDDFAIEVVSSVSTVSYTGKFGLCLII